MGSLIDAHIHFWDPTLHHHEWLVEVPELNRPLGPADVDFGARIPDGLVFVEADRAVHESLSEARWVAGLPSEVPIVGIVAHAPLHLGHGAEEALLQLAHEPLVVGVRRLLQGEPRTLLEAPELVEGTRLLAAHHLTSDLCVTWEQLPAVTTLVRACPDTSFVLDHLAKPDLAGAGPEPWREDLLRLATCPNVVCKLSGLSTQAPPGWQRDDLLRYLRAAIEAFGPERCMYGSDWPVSRQNTTYQDWLELVVEATEELTPAERAGVLGENAARVYGLRTTAPREESACS